MSWLRDWNKYWLLLIFILVLFTLGGYLFFNKELLFRRQPNMTIYEYSDLATVGDQKIKHFSLYNMKYVGFVEKKGKQYLSFEYYFKDKHKVFNIEPLPKLAFSSRKGLWEAKNNSEFPMKPGSMVQLNLGYVSPGLQTSSQKIKQSMGGMAYMVGDFGDNVFKLDDLLNQWLTRDRVLVEKKDVLLLLIVDSKL
jgi:hypothetical protein